MGALISDGKQEATMQDELLIDPDRARGIQTRFEMRRLLDLRVAQGSGDPIADEIRKRHGVILPPPTDEAFKTDAHSNPSESFNAEHFGRVMAEREMRRRQAL